MTMTQAAPVTLPVQDSPTGLWLVIDPEQNYADRQYTVHRRSLAERLAADGCKVYSLQIAFDAAPPKAAAAVHAAAAVAAAGDARLWCVNVQGPDDVHAMSSRDAALERANAFNATFSKHKFVEGDPIMRAVVIEWPHSPESHAVALRLQAEALAARAQEPRP